MFTSRPIGFVSSPYKDASEVPKGLSAKHEADGVLKILPEFEPGLTDIEGFSHLIVLWEFDRDRKSTRLNSSHANISYAVFCLKKKKKKKHNRILYTVS